jgi:dihydropyrimidinase
MSYDLVIKNGRIINAASTTDADVGIRGETIAVIGKNLSGEREIDARGKLVIPGAVDVHVHMDMPIGPYKTSDDFYSGTRAAAFGGTTCIVDFVETAPGQTMPQALAQRRALADDGVTIDYGLHMTIGPAEIDRLDQLAEVYDAGCVSFKLYMAYGLRLTDDQLFRAFEAVGRLNGWPVVHAENWDIIQELMRRNIAAGNLTPRWHPRSRPAIAEGEATGRAIDIATLAGTRLHIFHVSCEEAAIRIAGARARGITVTGETCPQYLLMTWDVYDRPGVEGAYGVCAPPIRDARAREALWRALGNGDLQVVSTDHCPFTRADKERGLANFSTIPGGVASVEVRLSAVYSEGVRRQRLTPNQWVDVCCTTPARLAGFRRKGRIDVGYDADIVIFDPTRQVTIGDGVLHENVDWSLYDGQTFSGWPAVTISRGDVIVEDGRFNAASGRGRYAERAYDG